MGSNIEIKNITTDDLHTVVNIHHSSFVGSALTKLGDEAIYRYYEWLLKGPHNCYALSASISNGYMIGFSFAGQFYGAMSGFLQKHKTFLIYLVLTRPQQLLNPIIQDRIVFGFKTLTRSNKSISQISKVSVANKISYGILAIAVDPSFQKMGVGMELMSHNEDLARKNGFTKMNLSVHKDNLQAIQFYEKQGWHKLENKNHNWDGKMIKYL